METASAKLAGMTRTSIGRICEHLSPVKAEHRIDKGCLVAVAPAAVTPLSLALAVAFSLLLVAVQEEGTIGFSKHLRMIYRQC